MHKHFLFFLRFVNIQQLYIIESVDRNNECVTRPFWNEKTTNF